MLIAVALLTALPGPLHAQSLLRWKLKPGEQFAVQMQQETESHVAFSGKSATTKINLDLLFTWTITGADEKAITLKQLIKRIQLKLATPQAATLHYDSAARIRPTGQARELADAMQPLIGAEMKIVMNNRGEILDAKPANEAAKGLFVADSKASDASSGSRSTVQQLLRQSLIVLPENEVNAGDTWSAASDLATAAGPLKQETTYRLAGTADRAGEQLSKIEMTSKLQPQSPPAASAPPASEKMTIKSHEQSGTILFAPAAGRLVEADQTQKLVTERPYRETTITVTLNSTLTTTLKPAP